MKISLCRAPIVLLAVAASIIFMDCSYAYGVGANWGTLSSGLDCDGAPRTLCGDGGGYEAGGSLPRGPECNDAAESELAFGYLTNATKLLRETLAGAVKDKDLTRQAACLHFLGLASKRQALKSISRVDRKTALDAAVGWYRQLVAIEPNNMEALQALLSIYEERGDSTLAEQTRRLIKAAKGTVGQSSCLGSKSKGRLQLAEGVLVPSSVSLVSTEKTETESCPTFKLDPAPQWTFSGILTAADSLFLADTRDNMILHYELPQKGKPTGIRSFEHFNSPIIAPSALKLADKGYILQYGKNLLSLQNEENTTVWQFDVTAGARGSEGSVTSLYNWTIAGGNLFGFSDILFANGVYKSGLFKAPLGDLGSFTVITQSLLDQADPGTVFYWGGFPYLTSIAGRAYFLAMEELPAIYEIDRADQQPRLVYRFADSYKRPGLPSPSQDVVKFFDAAARATMPVGLYSANHLLYVVMRIAHPSTVDWEIFKIDPAQGTLRSHRTLPMHSKHLVVIPGAKFWGFLEKGDFGTTGGPHQGIGALWLISEEKIESEVNLPVCAPPKPGTYNSQLTDIDTVQLHGTPLVIHE